MIYETENGRPTDFASVATKISASALESLRLIAERKGVSMYELLQFFCDTIVRYLDDRHNLTSEMERAMAVFEHADNIGDCYNLADPTVGRNIREAIYFFGDRRKKGVRAALVSENFFGKREEDCNVQRVFERMIELLFPERYRRLRSLAIRNDCNSLLELIDTMIDDASSAADLADIRRGFADDQRGFNGKKPAASPFKRKKHIDPDGLSRQQQRIQFGEEDAQQAICETDEL